MFRIALSLSFSLIPSLSFSLSPSLSLTHSLTLFSSFSSSHSLTFSLSFSLALSLSLPRHLSLTHSLSFRFRIGPSLLSTSTSWLVCRKSLPPPSLRPPTPSDSRSPLRPQTSRWKSRRRRSRDVTSRGRTPRRRRRRHSRQRRRRSRVQSTMCRSSRRSPEETCPSVAPSSAFHRRQFRGGMTTGSCPTGPSWSTPGRTSTTRSQSTGPTRIRSELAILLFSVAVSSYSLKCFNIDVLNYLKPRIFCEHSSFCLPQHKKGSRYCVCKHLLLSVNTSDRP